MTILVIRRQRGVALPEGAVYVGRGSRWGNSYRFGDDAVKNGQPRRTREEAIALYRNDLDSQAGRREVAELAARNPTMLACWCAPLPCHGDVLAEMLEATSGS